MRRPRRAPASHVASQAFIRTALLLWSLLAIPGTAVGHDIPDRILLTAFIKPEAERLHLVVRIPLVMFLNMNFPKRGPGFLALEHMEEPLERAARATSREIVLLENGQPLEPSRARARVSQPSSRSFESFSAAVAAIDGAPLPPETGVFWNQGYVDTHVVYPIRSQGSTFSLDFQVAPGLRERITLALRVLLPDGGVRAYELHPGTQPVILDPRWYQAAWTFVRLGAAHILDGIDHLLFLLCLVAPFRMRDSWTLVGVISSFTLAHSITLITAAQGVVPSGEWFTPLVEALIALSILYMAIENAVHADLRHRWWLAGLFGLIHGFGFSFVLEQEMQFAGSHLLLSLLSFNVGVELGQLVFLLVALPVLALLRKVPRIERYGVIVLSVLVGHTAWHWSVERLNDLRLVPWPSPDEIPVAEGLSWFTVIAVVVAAMWAMAHRRAMRRRRG